MKYIITTPRPECRLCNGNKYIVTKNIFTTKDCECSKE